MNAPAIASHLSAIRTDLARDELQATVSAAFSTTNSDAEQAVAIRDLLKALSNVCRTQAMRDDLTWLADNCEYVDDDLADEQTEIAAEQAECRRRHINPAEAY